MDVRVGLLKKAEPQRMDSFRKILEESLGEQGDQTSQSYRKSTLNIHWKD